MWRNIAGLLRGIFAAAIIAVGIGIGLLAGAAHAQSSNKIPGWDGFYAGLIGAPAWSDVDMTVGGVSATDRSYSTSAGLLAGYGFVTGNIFAGLEADITFTDLMSDWSLERHRASLVGRLGLLVSPTTLFYGLAGVAGGQYRADITTTSTTTTVIFDEEEEQIAMTNTVTGQTRAEKRLWGYTVGGGVEMEAYTLSLPLRLGVEYRYTDFDEWNISASGQPVSIDPTVQEVRFRIVMPFN